MAMKKLHILLVLLFPLVILAQNSVAIIPQPEKMTVYEGNFTINEKTIIICNTELPEANYLQNYLKEKHI